MKNGSKSDEERAVFKQLTISDFKKWSFTELEALSSPRQFLATESPLKMMANAFHFTLKALLVLQISKFLSRIFGHVEKQLD